MDRLFVERLPLGSAYSVLNQPMVRLSQVHNPCLALSLPLCSSHRKLSEDNNTQKVKYK